MMGGYPMDVHGAGPQRGDLRDGDRADFTFHDGPWVMKYVLIT